MTVRRLKVRLKNGRLLKKTLPLFYRKKTNLISESKLSITHSSSGGGCPPFFFIRGRVSLFAISAFLFASLSSCSRRFLFSWKHPVLYTRHIRFPSRICINSLFQTWNLAVIWVIKWPNTDTGTTFFTQQFYKMVPSALTKWQSSTEIWTRIVLIEIWLPMKHISWCSSICIGNKCLGTVL